MSVLHVLVICTFALTCNASLNVHDRMYVLLKATSPCVLRLNGTRSFGCTSSRSGNVGVLHLAHNASDLDWVLNASPMDSYTVGITFSMFNLETLKRMNSSSKIQGVLLMQNISRADVPEFSPEDTCPNRYSGLAAPPTRQNTCDQPWNVNGSGIMLQNWNIPIFFTDDKDAISKIDDCFHKFNLPLDDSQTSRSLCALEMTAHMYGSVDSRTCIRRSNLAFSMNPIQFCQALGDENIYAPIVPLANYKRKSYIVVATRMDATSLFYGQTPGALAAATSLVSLLLTAKLLFQLTNNADLSKYENNVLFVAFTGEAYDYIGSSRIVYDLKRGQFPFKEQAISKDDIKLYIELSQLFNVSELNYHTSSPEVQSFVGNFTRNAKKHLTSVNVSKSTRSSVPPSSMQSFLAMNSKLPGLVFSSYDDHFHNKYYHSIYDDKFNIKYTFSNGSAPTNSLQEYVAGFATTLAHTLYEMLANQTTPPTDVISKEESDQLLNCYVDSLDCEYFKQSGVIYTSRETKPNFYVSVATYDVNPLTTLTKYILIYFMGKNTTIADEQQCIDRMQTTFTNHVWLPDKKLCIESTVNSTSAVSPAFVIDNYDMTSGQYSTWTESSWEAISVRMFMKPSRGYEWLVFVTGILILIASFAITFWINRNAKQLFNYPNLITASNI